MIKWKKYKKKVINENSNKWSSIIIIIGMRKHPIDGFNKMHLGTDFAAYRERLLWLREMVLVTKAGWCGGGGNCVKIKHNSTYQTVYAHMSKFGRN